MTEQTAPRSNLTPARKVRGLNKSTIKLIAAMKDIAEEAHPITGRGVGYKLFAAGLIGNMNEMPKVYRALVKAREDGIIPWDWIVDETRGPECVQMWDSPAELARDFFYRRNLWQAQPKQVEVWSEKGTIRGVVWPVLAELGVVFQVMHGFNSATCMWNSSQNGNDDRPLVALYVGDYDPSGMFMSESDIPARLQEYGGHHIALKRIVLTVEQTRSLRSFPASDKSKDPRYKWFTDNYGDRCWELDAMDPRQLRDLVRAEINALIDPVLWAEQEAQQEHDRRSFDLHMGFLQQGEREERAAEIALRQLKIFQSLNRAVI